jgi:hypothetical protein
MRYIENAREFLASWCCCVYFEQYYLYAIGENVYIGKSYLYGHLVALFVRRECTYV